MGVSKMSKGYSEKDLISQFRIATGASEEDTYCYLEASNWNIERAFYDWRMDQRRRAKL